MILTLFSKTVFSLHSCKINRYFHSTVSRSEFVSLLNVNKKSRKLNMEVDNSNAANQGTFFKMQ